MPELPEVETVLRGLRPALEGRRIAEARAYVPKLRLPVPADFEARLSGARVTALRRRAKYLVMTLEDGPDVILHLGMSGHFTVLGHNQAAAWERAKHDHFMFLTDAGARIVYNDIRRFGLITFCAPGGAEAHPLLAGLGPEPLGDALDAAALEQSLAGRTTPIKVALLDQKLIAGVGNIYASEALHRAAISPRRKAASVRGRRLQRLAPAIRQVLEEAIAAGGSSLRDHAQVTGELGYFQHSFRVYGREGAPCPRAACGGTIRRIVQAQRSTFYCPTCQR